MASQTNQAGSSSLPRSSSCSTPRYSYDVFLSFRGEDTRRSFTDHLHVALVQAGFQTFMDDPELPRGEEISSRLLKVVQESKICIVILSKYYASSTWCLEELVQILKCRKTIGQLVIPVYVDVEPSDVRRQTGRFVEAFENHEKRFVGDMEKLGRWRAALAEVASLSGYLRLSDEKGFESNLIQKIVENVLLHLGPAELNTNQSDSSHFPPLSSTPRWHVFLSFRGTDTCKKFSGHLITTLKQVGVRVFIDDDELPRGKDVMSELLKAIQESKILIVVFSKTYASSSWCLDLLLQILKCRQTIGQFIVPVYLDVEPSDVRQQTGSFGEAFEKHEKRFDMVKLRRWRAALAEVASLAGYLRLSDEKGFESKLIQKIVMIVLFHLGPAELNINQSDSSHFKKFTGHLIIALKRVGIQAFIYDDELPRGKDVMSELLKAIQESKILIVVFAKNYASSEWFLDELVKIMECKRTTGQLVFPIFYDVRPLDVREQKGSFAEAFKSHEGHFKTEMEKVQKWRAALIEAANLAEWDLENAWNGYEPQLIQNVVEKVLLEVNPKRLYVAEHPVGTDSHVRKINSSLSLGSDVRLIGIYGMGGIGKTTIAKAVYNNIFYRFDDSCFIANVRERSKQPNGLVSLQEQLLSEILVNGNLKVGPAERGINLMEDRFSSRRILLVLDDVDNSRQVEALGEKRWFGSGSIIMITTRDVNLLNQVQVNERYEIDGLTEDESLELFSWHAFRKSVPLKDYGNISKSIATYTRGLPLALEVLGSYLFGKTVVEWDSAFEKLREVPNTEIQKILRISYDSLDDDKVKDIFLDIACFFVGMNKDVAINILDACGFYPKVGIRSLMDRGLLKIGKENDLWMHDLLRDMGREIIREKSPKPETRSRLWRQREACDVLRKKKGTEAIEGVVLDLSALEQRQFSTEAFERMDSLRLLLINNVYLTGRFEHIFDELRWLQWHYCPLKYLPPDFHPEKLVILDLQYSKLNRLWQGIKLLENLKILNLSYSEFLVTTPDFTKVPKLEKLLLEGCASLMDFHPSIESLDVLAYLNLKQCKKLRNLPSSICNIKSLECLDLDGCSNLEKLPDSIGRLTSLKSLSLKECNRSSITFPIRFFSCLTFPVGFVPPPISSLCLLTKFNLDGCNLSDEDIPDNIGSLSSLRALHLSENCFLSLPSTLSQLSNLEDLWLMNCRSLKSVPELPPTLLRLRADGCTSMLKLPNLSNLNHLEYLYMRNCIGLTEIHGLENLDSVRSIRMEGCSSLKTTFVDILVQYTKFGKSFQFFLPRSEIPGWFSHRRAGSLISFNMPFDVENRLGMTLWIVYSAKDDVCMAGYSPCAIIRNGTNEVDMKHLCLYTDISVTKKEHSWVTYIPWTNFDYPVDGGERFEVRIKEHPAVVVKECGIYTRRSR